MNIQESRYILDVLEAAFPSFYKDVSQNDLIKIIKLWQEMFKDDTIEIVASAVKALIATKVDSFPPTIGAVKEQIVKIKQPHRMSEMEAWDLVNKACRNGSHHANEEFEKLPEVIQRTIGSADQLRVWAQMDEATVNSVVASNFMRTFKTKQQQQKEVDMLPNDIKTMLGTVSESMKLQQADRAKLKSFDSGNRMLNAPPVNIGEYKKMAEVIPPKEAYKVPDDAEWERLRDEALGKLQNKENRVGA